MAQFEAASIGWFVEFMRLSNRGVIPSVTLSELMPTRHQLAEFWGPKDGHGYIFKNFGSEAYEHYVRILLLRVLQTPWPLSGAIPFHFAKGLIAEAIGMDVDWAEFAFKVTHLHQSHTSIPAFCPSSST